jgi:hypothetical protein
MDELENRKNRAISVGERLSEKEKRIASPL